MKKIILSSILCATLIYASEANATKATETSTPSATAKEAIGYIKMLGKTLKGQLKQHLQADKSGVEAMNFCASKADELTKEVNAKLPKGAKVRRTSLLTRNEANKADETDLKVMEQFKKAIEAGKTPKKPVVVETKTETRVYKAQKRRTSSFLDIKIVIQLC
jgi:hypothetical protein